jgi:hypothetical protein
MSAGTPPPLTHEQLGVLAVHLALTFPAWIRRRKTTFTYVDDTTIRQRQSVDIRLPQADLLPPHARPAADEQIYVPLYIAEKGSLVKFSVTDEAGASVSLLNTTENGGLATVGLNALVNGLSGEPGRASVAANSLKPILRTIVTARSADGADVAASALHPSRPLGRVLTTDDVYKALVRDLARGFLMLVPLPYDPGRDRCLKIEHQTRQEWHYGTSTLGSRLARGVARGASSLAVADKLQGFEALQIGWARGTHFEFEAPEDVVLGEATLNCVQWDPTHRRPIRIDARRTVFERPAIDLHIAPRVDYDPTRDSAQRRAELLQCRQDTAEVAHHGQLRHPDHPDRWDQAGAVRDRVLGRGDERGLRARHEGPRPAAREANDRTVSTPGRIRTYDLLLRRQALYPLSYGRVHGESRGRRRASLARPC